MESKEFQAEMQKRKTFKAKFAQHQPIFITQLEACIFFEILKAGFPRSFCIIGKPTTQRYRFFLQEEKKKTEEFILR